MHNPRLFPHILINTAIAGFTNMLIWFAITFWVFLETRSVFVTGMLGGIYLVLNLFGGIWFGSFVDHHPKRRVMLTSSVVSFGCYSIGAVILTLLPSETWSNMWSPWLWIWMFIMMLGVVTGNIRMIALSTLVTILIPE
jgi:MFS transporter, DHA3 family, multidrug efflux protein